MSPINRSQMAPCNGVKMCDDAGLAASGAQEWITIPNGSIVTFQFLLEGGAGDADVDIEVALIGGEAEPEVIVSRDPTSEAMFTAADVAYDQYRVNCTSYAGPGAGSQVLVSAR